MNKPTTSTFTISDWLTRMTEAFEQFHEASMMDYPSAPEAYEACAMLFNELPNARVPQSAFLDDEIAHIEGMFNELHTWRAARPEESR